MCLIDEMQEMLNDKPMSIVKPITPSDIAGNPQVIHPGVLEVVNDLLKQKFRNGQASIKQKDIVDEFMKRNPGFNRESLFTEHHMDFEDVYRKAGWIVRYDKPAYNESGEPYFEFRQRGKKS